MINTETQDNNFDTKKIKASEGIGLSNTKSRIEYLKGQIDIDSSPGNGTLVAIFVPNN